MKNNINYFHFWLKGPPSDLSWKECGMQAAKKIRQKSIWDKRKERNSNYFICFLLAYFFLVKIATLGREINKIINQFIRWIRWIDLTLGIYYRVRPYDEVDLERMIINLANAQRRGCFQRSGTTSVKARGRKKE